MKILVLNSGSSSLKYQLFTIHSVKCELIFSGLIEQIGDSQILDHSQALEKMIQTLKEKQHLQSLTELSGIGHRVVHGGEEFTAPVIINEQVITAIEKLCPLAPLHNPANLMGIQLARKKAPKILQVAVFDTAFHQSIPEQAYLYALPYSLYEQHKIRRYGFHGTSHHYVTQQASLYLNKPLNTLKLISIHLGNGASATAINKGQSIDTSMGMTPLEGLVMGTRSGDIDPAILFYLNRKTGMNIDELDTLLNKQSGLKGICGENDMRRIIDQAEQGDHTSTLAIDIFCYHIKKYIGAYLASLNGVDAIIFTGGIGENAPLIRQMACENLNNLGIKMDTEKNQQKNKGNSIDIQHHSSLVKILVIPTDEELEIAEQTIQLINKTTD